jgi:hypothetical protein
MKITKRQLRRLIKEAILCEEVDTDAYEGDHERLLIEIPALEKFATEQNFDGEQVWHEYGDAGRLADILEEDEPEIGDYDYDKEEWKEAVDNWNKVHDHLEDWSSSDKEELADNIRSAVQSTKDSGYEY